MAAAVPNQLLDLLRALKRRRYQVIVPAILVATFGIAFAVIVPKRYRVSMRIDIGDRTRVESDARLKNPQEVAVRREAASAHEHIVNYTRVKDFVESNLSLWPDYAQANNDGERYNFISKRILKDLSAQPTLRDAKGGGTIFIEISYSDEDPTRAAKLLDGISAAWLKEMFESDRTTLLDERAEFQDMIGTQQAELTESEDRLYAVYERLGIDPSSSGLETRRDDPRDWAFKQLDKAKTELADVEFTLELAQFEQLQAEQLLRETPAVLRTEVTPEADDPDVVLAQHKKELVALEEEIENLRPSNSTYKRLKPKIDALRQEIAELASQEPEVDSRWVEEPNERYDEYDLALRSKRDEVGRLGKKRDELAQVVANLELETKARSAQYKELDELENEVTLARELVNRTRREWQDRDTSLQLLDRSQQAWIISKPPLPSAASTQPNPWLLATVSVVLGLALGLGLAVLTEFARSCYRSTTDLASVMGVPVLGAIETIVTRKERRRLQLAHATAGLSTAVIVGTIGWLTWLWYSAPERLPLEVQDAIERLRSALK
ncbi:MAG: hypothetical protein HOP15_07860 [Planctomycetes bacterium]|nr:hypothetical protein [Planctomycetota bacterium]